MANPDGGYMLELDNEFLNRIKQAYRHALSISNDYHGVIWRDIDSKKASIHNALMADSNDSLRGIFAHPEETSLFIGINLLRPDWQSTAEVAQRGSHSRAHVKEAIYHSTTMLSTNPKSIVEIGPGMGLAASCMRLNGITDYTTIDLPLGIVAQAAFLGRWHGPKAICLPGEVYLDGQIRMLVAGQYPDRFYDLAFNADSLTEMSFRAALGYLKWLHGHCGCFIAIGKHNNLFTIKDISAKYFVCKQERPYPIRSGYTEYVLIPRPQPTMLPWHRLAWHIMKLVKSRGIAAAITFAQRRLYAGGRQSAQLQRCMRADR